jgi:uncharacterized protein (TIGR03084 family)
VTLQVSIDLRAEADELHAFLQTLGDSDWSRPTPFKQWMPWDVVAHLHYFDRFSLLALGDVETFAAKREEMVASLVSGMSGAEITRRELGDLRAKDLLAAWHETCHEMAEKLGACDAKRRLPWFGPDMAARTFTSARYMETWAHGQDVYDLMHVRRTHTDRIQHIAVLGVKTYGWTFANRKLEVPGPPPYVRLVAPSGAIWEWNEPSESSAVRGDALEFCQVVTQGRSFADTRLEAVGDAARRWMEIAQCFAGGPADPPQPGERAWESAG